MHKLARVGKVCKSCSAGSVPEPCDLCKHGVVSDPADLVSTADAARAIGVDRATLSRWAKAGHVEPAQKTIGGHMRWNVEDLRRQVETITGSHLNPYRTD